MAARWTHLGKKAGVRRLHRQAAHRGHTDCSTNFLQSRMFQAIIKSLIRRRDSTHRKRDKTLDDPPPYTTMISRVSTQHPTKLASGTRHHDSLGEIKRTGPDEIEAGCQILVQHSDRPTIQKQNQTRLKVRSTTRYMYKQQ